MTSPTPLAAPATPSDPAAAADAATAAILDDVRNGTQRGTVVDSPPGAGKSTLVVRAARELVGAGERLMVVAQTNSQVDDLVDRLASAAPDVSVGRLHGSDAAPAPYALRHGNVTAAEKIDKLAELDVVVSTAAKWQWVKSLPEQGGWRHAIVDEAYQMRSDALLAVARHFERALFVGDPGQLDPFTMVDNERWAGLAHDPSSSAVSTLLAFNRGIRPHRLPVSWRLPASAAPLVSEAFYPDAPFRAGTEPGERALLLGPPTGPAAGASTGPGAGARALSPAYDDVLDTAAETGWGLLELPPAFTERTDPEAVEGVAQVVGRLLARRPVARSERGDGEVTEDRIAVGTAHRDQAAAIRAALARLGVRGVTVDTANRLQGREFDVTVVLHPLSGRPDATEFHLEAGRLCVLVSRHRVACVVVARAGIPELLDAHPVSGRVRLGAAPSAAPDGWEANQSVLHHLARSRVPLRPGPPA
ncbi:AAA domain-containing protein [Phaeacidiphilus oryzae]|uniref:AAA domain-containing protein n=1 Tax=Phaeacidiphilus oryzae TaxID=348818 RepID=UPI000567BCA4|nr:AAA domain-containing protein [Phaeacidiphilus oryzae]